MYPALAAAEAIHTQHPKTSLSFVGTQDGFERPLVEQSGVSFDTYDTLQAGALHGVPLMTVLRSLVKNSVGTLQAWRLLGRVRPSVILLTGGWVSLPMALAGWLRRVPILIYLPDIEPGLAIRTLQPFARKVAVSVPDSAQYFPEGKTVVTGYPLRRSVSESARAAALAHFGLSADKHTLLVFGGSRGAQSINSAVLGILPQLLALDIQVLHVTGTLDWERVQAQTAAYSPQSGYFAYPYLHDEMGLALAAADVALCRSGASVLGELPHFGLPAVLVPYPYAWRYQKVNADYLAARGGALVLPDEQMPAQLYEVLHNLFKNPERLATMRAQMKQLSQPNSAAQLAGVLTQLAGETLS